MSIAFSRSLRSMRADSPRRWLRWLLWGVLVLGAWGLWFGGARVKVVAVAPQARLDVIRSTFPLEAPVAGRILHTTLLLGRKVKAGEVLVAFDDTRPRLLLREEKARLQAATSRLKALEEQIRAEKVSLYRERKAAKVALAESKLQYKAAELSARLAADQLRRSRRLYRKGHLAREQYLTTQTEAQKTRATADALRLKSKGLGLTQQQQESSYRVRLASLQREVAALQGERMIRNAACERLAHDLQDFKIIAPRDGHLGNVVELQKGAVVEKGKHLGTLIARGEVKVIAEFAPADALGRIRPNQLAQLRLDGFSWVQYGSIAARVSHVASVPQQGKIRVELKVLSQNKTSIPLKHGMPGVLEVELERVSPATLLLRAVGKLMVSSDASRNTAGTAQP